MIRVCDAGPGSHMIHASVNVFSLHLVVLIMVFVFCML